MAEIILNPPLFSRLSSGPLICIGRAGMDLYPEPIGCRTENANNFIPDVGGTAGNVSVAISRQGGKVFLLTVFSDDQVGNYVLSKCKEYGVNISLCRSQAGLARNSLAIAETRAYEPAVVIYRNNAADLQLACEDFQSIDFKKIGGLIVTGTAFSGEPSSSAVREAISDAKQAGCPVIIDIDYRPDAWQSAETAANQIIPEVARADILFGNDDEFELISRGREEDGLEVARQYGIKGQLVFYKMGEKGCLTFFKKLEIRTGIFPVELLKPFGAGDAFLGNVLISLCENPDVRTAVIRGSAAASFVVSRSGCASAMPDREQLSQLMVQYEMTKI